jgi:hypothetical protein
MFTSDFDETWANKAADGPRIARIRWPHADWAALPSSWLNSLDSFCWLVLLRIMENHCKSAGSARRGEDGI